MTSPVREGEIIAGKYRIDRVLGAGGMGIVVSAQHLQLKQRVAIKFLLDQAMAAPDSVARFLREAQAAARIQSEHVARVLDVSTLESGAPYMVMEFLEGSDLAELLEQRGPLPLAEAVGYLLEACEGVAEAHAAGVVHRDLKPANLFLCQRGSGRSLIKVLDFGISKTQNAGAAESTELALTKTSAVMGSPVYMSPEQMASAKNVDARTDIWSLGVSLFELVTGERPFGGETLTELIASVLRLPPRSLRELQHEIPSEFESALTRSLEKERTERYQTVADFAAAIAPFGPSHSDAVVERISRTLGVTPQSGPAFDATQRAPELLNAARAREAQAASAGGSTSKAVWAEGAPSVASGTRSRTLLLLGAAALVGLGGMAWSRWQTQRADELVRSSALPLPSAPSAVALGASATAPVASHENNGSLRDAGTLNAAGGSGSSALPSASAMPPPLPPTPRRHQDLLDRRE
jgi:eukaryotic-like serine/threonine-protein kinase